MFEQITADQLAEKIDSGDGFVLIDTRPDDSYESWHISGAENLPFGPVERLSDEQEATIDAMVDSQSIVTICGKGVTSTNLAAELDASGYDDVTVVKGGMRDWNARYEQTSITTSDDLILTQFQRRAKGCLSHLVGSRSAGEAIVIDPTRHIEQYIVAAAEADVTITHVLDTHIHADHVSGGRRLAASLDVPYHLGASAHDRDLAFDFHPLEDGDTLQIGGVEITALYAPGHTSEMMNYRIDAEAILTGDALFVDSVGRTELEFGEIGAENGAQMEYETLHETLLEQPDDLTVLPGHVTITSDGEYENGSPGEPVSTSLGDVQQRLDLVDLDEDEFVDYMVSNVPDKPDNYETIIELNLGKQSMDNVEDITSLETGANNCAA